jgi:cyclopropane-fatty-acyl-phospholipid synthase
MSFLHRALAHVVGEGSLTLIDCNGKAATYGDGSGCAVAVRFHDRALARRVLANPSLAFGEAYMDGRLTVEDGTIYDFLELLTRNMAATGMHPVYRALSRLDAVFRRFQQHNPIYRARRNVAHHYDLSSELYELFLDVDRQYSCAYFVHPEDSIDTAQENKKRHIAAKLNLKPGVSVFDIGSGWGGLGLYIAEVANASVTGVTLSEEQHRVANNRARRSGLVDRARFHLRDFREQTGRFDRIVSVGMFEHVGVGHYREYFEKIEELLAEDGVALLHTIGRSGPPTSTDPWIRKYIFPGGYIPALSEVMPHIERSGLMVTDIEFLGRHYAETLRRWSERFQAKRDRVRDIYDERFCRMWEYYLATSEVAFRHLGMTVFQIQITRRPDAVPMTRSYIEDWERANGGASSRRNRAA